MSVEPDLEREMQTVADEPLLPIEKKLIVVSLILGVVLLALLAWVSTQFFSVP
jgi:hypothetical protein